ncbi:MAG: hypothetical protein ISP10_05490 [Aeromicrobium sp.]|jgi:hypothetical protein|nr:hypothetical protein [Aeromicrobium sp.]
MHRRIVPIGIMAALVVPAPAFAASGDVPPVLSTGAGVVTLAAAAGLLVVMLSLRSLAQGAAIAENITYAVLAVVCLSASVLVGWLGRAGIEALSAEQARLAADLLGLAAMVLFGVYFFRVRQAMSRFLKRLDGESQMLATVLDPDVTDQQMDSRTDG